MLPPLQVAQQEQGLVKRAAVGAGLAFSDNGLQNLGVAGVTIMGAVGGVVAGSLIGAATAAASSKQYEKDMGVGAVWGSIVGAIAGVTTGLILKHQANPSPSSSTGT